MNRQFYRSALRNIDKQLSVWGKYAEKLSQARVNAPTKAKQAEVETSLMVLSRQIYKLLADRKKLVMEWESTNHKEERPSDEQ